MDILDLDWQFWHFSNLYFWNLHWRWDFCYPILQHGEKCVYNLSKCLKLIDWYGFHNLLELNKNKMVNIAKIVNIEFNSHIIHKNCI